MVSLNDPTLDADVRTRIRARHFPARFFVGATLWVIGAAVAILTNGPGGPPYSEVLLFVIFGSGGAGIMLDGLRAAIRKAQLEHDAAKQPPAGKDGDQTEKG